ncbi:acyl-CoA reductase [Flagellimonas spongiicola]
MMAYNAIVQAFVKLGGYLQDFCENGNPELQEQLLRAEQQNSWFAQDNLHFCLKHWATQLTADNLNSWLEPYAISQNDNAKNIGVVMAGNIPLVGFHDFICALCAGHKIQAKLSSNDTVLLPYLTTKLIEFEPSLKNQIQFVDGKMEGFDAVIATGSNNTSRYFEYYFGKKPNIIRKNRNAIAVLTGKETAEELFSLGNDIFRYFGLGCRNVSKLYVPEDYNFDVFFTAIFDHKDIVNQHKYANNYDYNKTVYLMSEFKILDNGFLILKEDESFASPIASLFFERYSDLDALKSNVTEKQDEIQCIVSKDFDPNEVPFGQTQLPNLKDYADGVDTMDFLLQL